MNLMYVHIYFQDRRPCRSHKKVVQVGASLQENALNTIIMTNFNNARLDLLASTPAHVLAVSHMVAA